jgi:hypothetical protein
VCCVLFWADVRNRTGGRYPHELGRIHFSSESQPDESEEVQQWMCAFEGVSGGLIVPGWGHLLQMPSPSRSPVDWVWPHRFHLTPSHLHHRHRRHQRSH